MPPVTTFDEAIAGPVSQQPKKSLKSATNKRNANGELKHSLFERNGCTESVGYYSKSETSEVNYPRAMDLIGKTPLLDLTALANPKDPRTRVLGKAEYTNPGFSHKDRIIHNIITKAENSGELKKGGTVVCASSGNTGCSCAMVCTMRGYDCIVITSPKCSSEKMNSIKAFGAQLIVSKPGQNYMDMEKELADANPSWFSVNQYANLDNREAHIKTTGPEIYEQTCGNVSHFVMSGSTGGTISGVGSYLKNKNPDVKLMLADPVGSVFTNYFKTGDLGKPQKFLVEGVGKESIPGCMNMGIIDEVVPVSDKDAFAMCKRLARHEGIFVGGSAGLNVKAAVDIANQVEGPATIVTILCDNGVKYLSKVFNDTWLQEHEVYTDIDAPAESTNLSSSNTVSIAKRAKVDTDQNGDK